MPNWIEGTLKLRGASENLKRFFSEGLESSSWFGEETPLGDFVECDFDGEYCEVNLKNEPHVCNTRRAFITGSYVGWEKAYDTVAVEVKQAWSFDTDQWIAISKKYDLDIRLFGFECGMQFMQSIEIIKGELTIDECIECDDYVWECPMPLLGG